MPKMKLHIELDSQGGGVVLWIVRTTRSGPFRHSPGSDPDGLGKIDPKAEADLRQFLEIAASGDWQNWGLDADGLARSVSSCLQRVEETLPRKFNEPSELVIPDTLSRVLQVSNQPIEVSAWLKRYPPPPKQGQTDCSSDADAL